MSAELSCNIDKIALLRNSRSTQSLVLADFVNIIFEAGCKSITVHPRDDERHILLSDIKQLMNLERVKSNELMLNIETNLNPNVMKEIIANGTHQVTIVPTRVGELTTERGLNPQESIREILAAKADILSYSPGTLISMFVDPDARSIDYAKELSVDAIELHTKDYALAFSTHNEDLIQTELKKIMDSIEYARKLNLKVNLGHDLSLANLPRIIELKPDIEQVSIGHALVLDALKIGLENAVKRYIEVLEY